MGRFRRARRETPAERREQRAAASDVEEVLDSAARFLEVRSRSVAEVRRRLLSAGYPTALVEVAAARLTEQGYLDDEQFARAWVESRDRARPRGERALRLELAQKGVSREIIDAVLADRAVPLETGEPSTPDGARRAEEDAAGRLLDRHRRSLLRGPDPAKRRQKAYALLARNGFDPDTCRNAALSFEAGLTSDHSDAR